MFTIKATPDNGEPSFILKISTRDVLVWEKAGPNRSMAKLVSDMHMADIYKVAHITARRTQVFAGDLKQFEETIDLNITDVLGVEEPDPTQSVP